MLGMKRRLREGAHLIVIDPRRIDLVRSPHIEADYHLPLKPGTYQVTASLGAAISGLLGEPPAAASRLAAEIAAMPAPEDLVGTITALAGHGRAAS